jgi:hypothetical protein
LTQTDRIVGIASLVLFISLFLSWYSIDGFGASGLSAHNYLYITLILSIAIVGLLVAQALSLWKLPDSSPVARDQLLLIATGVNFVLVLLAFIFKPGGGGAYGFHYNWGWSFGSFIGLIAAIVAVVPMARPAIEARRGK